MVGRVGSTLTRFWPCWLKIVRERGNHLVVAVAGAAVGVATDCCRSVPGIAVGFFSASSLVSPWNFAVGVHLASPISGLVRAHCASGQDSGAAVQYTSKAKPLKRES